MNTRARGAKRPLSLVSAVVLALASSSAMALGLGDIRVLSQPGQPLLAEIPVISADPSELQNLRVSLASPDTFARVGLAAPSGVVGELQFELTRNAQGRAVVRVTSHAPVQTASLSFLVEADWGQGRLVREYSALVDAPSSALAVAEPEIIAPAGAPSNTIVRTPAPAAAPAAAAAPANAASAASAPRRAPAAAAAADGSLTVQRGQTLSALAAGVAREHQVSRDRAMIALLRANPEAFIRGNVNLLKQGAVLRVPGADALAAVDAAEAAALVREHTAQWRQARTLPQPVGVPPSATTAAAAASAPAAGARLEIAPALAADAAHAGMTTGTAAGSEGDMQGNEQLRQAREDVATRDAEIDELKQRVADLEKLQKQQQSLIAMKDNDLAAAQQRLAQAPGVRDAGTPWYWLGLPVLLLAALGAWRMRRRKPSPLPPLPRDSSDAAGLAAAVPAGAGLDVLAEQDGWAPASAPTSSVRQEPSMPAWAGAHADADAVDATTDEVLVHDWTPDSGLGVADSTDKEQTHAEDVDLPAPVTAAPQWDEPLPHSEPLSEAEPEPAPEPAPGPSAADGPDVPAYALHAQQQPEYRGVFELPASQEAEIEASDVSLPPQATDDRNAMPHVDADADAHASADAEPTATAADAPLPLARAGQERLELAIAYLDLGDADTARLLLHEVAEGGDAHCQAQARELLARLP
ncbi:MAG: hypothetical protein GAK31_01373 [Stenotrophomonas maltophilia]|uniref:FimV N-terminal domain-containing protein n=1 Tax=Stenotrophomonas maltophilia TaxID=40324 RepID=A0A7V8FHE8_STEMA|nr:MAG: hypothetical protein GAK31_01373 [Stenotrophomonas maltophilia]